MLLKFAVTNFLSIRDEAELSFVAASLKEKQDTLIPSKYSTHGVLPVLAVYGANASGKSNALHSFGFLKWLVLNSFKGPEKNGPLARPFLLDDDSAEKPTRLVLDFVHEEVRYEFGVEMTQSAVASEWLYQFPKKARQLLYERRGETFKFGRALQGSNRQIQSITRPNALFLSTAVASNHPELTKIRDYFQNRLIFQAGTSPEVVGEETALAIESDEALRDELVRQLALADTGVAALKVEREQLPESTASEIKQFQDVLLKFLGSPPTGVRLPSHEFNLQLRLGHTGADGKVHYLDYRDESLGTRYLLKLLPSMLRALKVGSVLILDEITTGLHTLLAKQLVALFQDKRINRLGAQLVFSTHDTNLLSPGLMRRDEIWFAEKGSDGATTLFPLTDIRTKNTDNIERGYIQGRFGAVPVLPQGQVEPA